MAIKFSRGSAYYIRGNMFGGWESNAGGEWSGFTVKPLFLCLLMFLWNDAYLMTTSLLPHHLERFWCVLIISCQNIAFLRAQPSFSIWGPIIASFLDGKCPDDLPWKWGTPDYSVFKRILIWNKYYNTSVHKFIQPSKNLIKFTFTMQFLGINWYFLPNRPIPKCSPSRQN